MSDYTTLGIRKIAQQAAQDARLIRCPRDGAVMRVVSARAQRTDGRGPEHREFEHLPAGKSWSVIDLDVECPACRRRAERIKPGTAAVEAVHQCGLFDASLAD